MPSLNFDFLSKRAGSIPAVGDHCLGDRKDIHSILYYALKKSLCPSWSKEWDLRPHAFERAGSSPAGDIHLFLLHYTFSHIVLRSTIGLELTLKLQIDC